MLFLLPLFPSYKHQITLVGKKVDFKYLIDPNFNNILLFCEYLHRKDRYLGVHTINYKRLCTLLSRNTSAPVKKSVTIFVNALYFGS